MTHRVGLLECQLCVLVLLMEFSRSVLFHRTLGVDGNCSAIVPCCLVEWPPATWLLGSYVGRTEEGTCKCYLILSNLKLNIPIWLVTTLAIMTSGSSQSTVRPREFVD